MDPHDNSSVIAFDAWHYPKAERMAAYSAYVHGITGGRVEFPSYASLSADNPDYNRIERYRNSNLWFSILRTSGFSVEARPSDKPNERKLITLCYVRSGELEFRDAKKAAVLKSGDVYINFPNTTDHQITFGDCESIRLFFPRSDFGGLHDQEGQIIIPGAHNPVARVVKSLLSGIEQDAQSASQQNEKLLSRIARDLVYNIATDTKSSVDQSRYEFLFERGRAYINNHLHEPDLDANAIARHLSVSRATLYRVFEPQGGVRSCITRLRLDAARRMLLSVPMQRGWVSNVAYSCGFTSPELFSRAFRVGFGISPREFSERNFGI